MSIGNLKDYGNKGNNFPWQLKVLEGLQCICDSINKNFAPQIRKANILNDNTTGTVPPCYSFSIANVGSTAGTVDGQTLLPGSTINYDAGTLNNTFPGMPYDATGTTFLITWVG